ncbi:integral membrane protein [Cyclospora cayetanensis]|uniref:Integral membrane protein n=1 Tax=Cyclospora cayetanensis TaxID=88456 RepID=A0A1D3DA52_9EIME|nr:integral membrane protein [Cyclospora cayetanensis]
MEGPAVDPHVTVLLVCAGCLMGLLGEALCYIFVYSKTEFKRLQSETNKLWRDAAPLTSFHALVKCFLRLSSNITALEAECVGGPDGRYLGRTGRAAAALQAKIHKKTKYTCAV